MTQPVKIIMVEDDHGHAKLIEKNIRRANIANDIAHFADGGSAMDYLFSEDVRLNGPMLILRGEHSDILSRAAAEKMTTKLAKARLVEVPGVGHAPMLSEPRSRGALLSFLEIVA